MGSRKKVVQRERRADASALTQIGRELEVRPDQRRVWTRVQREVSGEGSAPPGETLEQENRRRRREVVTLRQEQAFAHNVAIIRGHAVAPVRDLSVTPPVTAR